MLFPCVFYVGEIWRGGQEGEGGMFAWTEVGKIVNSLHFTSLYTNFARAKCVRTSVGNYVEKKLK